MRTMIGLEDSTGSLNVTFYQKSDNNQPSALQNFDYREDEAQWVRVSGFIRVFKDQKNIVGINLQEITKQDHVTNHLLKVFVSSQMRKKGVLSSDDLKAQKDKQPSSNFGQAPVRSNGDVSKQIMDTMRDIMSNRSQTTINKNDIWTYLQRNMSNPDFEKAIQDLQNDGVIYTTVDDNTFALTDE